MKTLLKKIRDHTWEVTEPINMEIGIPATPPSDETLEAIRAAISSTRATTVYWFWVSIAGDMPHLGLAVAPADDEIISHVGRAVEPIWRKHSPENPVFDILRLSDPDINRVVKECGQILYGTV